MTKAEIAAKAAEDKLAADKLAAEQKAIAEKAEADKKAKELYDNPTNEKTEVLAKQRIEFLTKSREYPVDSVEDKNLRMEAWKCEQAIIAEVASIKKERSDNERKLAEAAKTKLLQDVIETAQHAMYGDNIPPAGESTDEQKIAAKTAFDTVLNIVLGSTKSSGSSAKSSTASTGAGSKGATTAAIRAYARPFYDGATRDTVGEIGKKVRKDLIDQDFNDGTMNAAVRALEVELGLKD